MVYNMSIFETNIKNSKFSWSIQGLAVLWGTIPRKCKKLRNVNILIFIGVKWNTNNFSSHEFENDLVSPTLYLVIVLLQFC